MENIKYEVTLDIEDILTTIVGSPERLEQRYLEAKHDKEFAGKHELQRAEFYLGYFLKVTGTLEQFGKKFCSMRGMDEPGQDLISSAYVMTNIAKKLIAAYIPKMQLELNLMQSEMQEQIDYGKKFSPKMEEN